MKFHLYNVLLLLWCWETRSLHSGSNQNCPIEDPVDVLRSPNFFIIVNRLDRRIVLGCCLGSDSRKVSKVWCKIWPWWSDRNENFLLRSIVRDIFAQNLLQKAEPVPQLNRYGWAIWSGIFFDVVFLVRPKGHQGPVGEPITIFNFENRDYSESFRNSESKCEFLVIHCREWKIYIPPGVCVSYCWYIHWCENICEPPHLRMKATGYTPTGPCESYWWSTKRCERNLKHPRCALMPLVIL